MSGTVKSPKNVEVQKNRPLENNEGKDMEEFRKSGYKMVDFIIDYMKNIDDRSVTTTMDPGFLAPLLDKKMPDKPVPFEDVLKDVDEKIMPGLLNWNHKNFFAYFGGGNAYPSLLADMLSSATGAVGFSWASCPSITELEKITLDWFAQALHLPEFFLSKQTNPKSNGGGSLQGSASDAINAAMTAARHRALEVLRGDKKHTHPSVFLKKLVGYGSKEAHSCVEKAGMMNLVKFRTVEVDEHEVMTGEALQRAIDKDIARGLTPFFVCATLGTTGSVAFDNMEDIAKVAKQYPLLWIHADGAYGGNSFILPEMREKFMKGIEQIDSIEINPNKLLLTGFDCTCLWVKHVVEFTSAFAIDTTYLQHQHDHDVVDLRHFGVPLSRRFRSLKLFFMFKMYGLEALQAHVRRVIKRGEYFLSLVKSDDRFKVMNDVHLGLVCFKLIGSEDLNKRFVEKMNGSAKIHVTPAHVKGHYVTRWVSNQENYTTQNIDDAWAMIKEFAEEVLNEGDKPTPMSVINSARYQRNSLTFSGHTKQQLWDGATPIFLDGITAPDEYDDEIEEPTEETQTAKRMKTDETKSADAGMSVD